MIALTGDVHHSYSRNLEQKFSDRNEVDLALEYTEIAAKYGVKVTLFCTGKSILQEPKLMKKLAGAENVEVGGHTYNAFDWAPKEIQYIMGKIWGSSYGPRFLQKRDIEKTLEIMDSKLDLKIKSWRTHAFSSNQITIELLREKGIKALSDDIDRERHKPYKMKGIVHLPINTIVDHDCLLHAHITEKAGTVGSQNNPGGLCGSEYFTILQKQVESIESKGVATMLCHPLCMYTLDKFETFKRLCSFLSQYKSIYVGEIQDVE